MMTFCSKKRLIAATLFATIFGTCLLPSFATVGGGQTIEVLGYASSEQKIFVLRHFEDGRGRLPQLYYYDLGSKNPQKLVEVRSIYLNPQTNQYDEFDNENTYFQTRLEKIKKRVKKLKTEFQPNSIKVHSISQQRVPSWLEGNTYQYKFNYSVVSNDNRSSSRLQSVTSYDVSLKSDDNIYQIPNQPYTLTKVTYTGTDMELRYQYEDVVLMKIQ